MKKTLVALAAATAVAAFAQTTVTLSGNLDVAGANLGGTMPGAKSMSFGTSLGVSSTSVINIIATEDLGGGTSVTAKYGIDPRTLFNDSMVVTNNPRTDTTAATINPQAATVTTFARDEAFIGITGGFGSIKLGAPNAPSLDTHSASSPLGTAIGSGYSFVGGTNTMWTAVTQTRYSRSIRYDTPTVNGLTAAVQYAPGNDESPVTGSTAYQLRSVPNNRTFTELGLRYNNGPMNLAFTNVSQLAQTNAVGWYAVAAATAGITSTYAYVATKTNTLGANYNLGTTTLYYGYANGDSIASTTSQTKAIGQRLGAKQSMGAIDISAQYTTLKTTALGASTSTTQKVTGLRVDNNLSKTSKIYFGYEYADSGSVVASTNTASGTRTTTSVGLQKSF